MSSSEKKKSTKERDKRDDRREKRHTSRKPEEEEEDRERHHSHEEKLATRTEPMSIVTQRSDITTVAQQSLTSSTNLLDMFVGSMTVKEEDADVKNVPLTIKEEKYKQGNTELDTMDEGDESELKIFLCNDHGTLKSRLRPATVIIASDKCKAEILLEDELKRKGYPSFREKKYNIVAFDERQKQVIMMTMEEIGEKKMLRDDIPKNVIFWCSSHDVLPPLGPGTIISDQDHRHAQQMFDTVLFQKGLKTFDEMPYTLVELQKDKPRVIILFNGDLRTL